MKKHIFIGDVHGRDTYKQFMLSYHKYIHKTPLKGDIGNFFVENPDVRLVFVGDYFDNFDIGVAKQNENFKNIIALKKEYPQNIVLLIGNHDYHYFPDVYSQYNGYTYNRTARILLEEYYNKGLMQVTYAIDDVLVSHAGISKTWFKNTFDGFVNAELVDNGLYGASDVSSMINEAFNTCYGLTSKDDFELKKARHTESYDNTGDNIWQSPIWIRPKSLLEDKLENITQIVGHSFMPHTTYNDGVWFIDTPFVHSVLAYYENKSFQVITF